MVDMELKHLAYPRVVVAFSRDGRNLWLERGREWRKDQPHQPHHFFNDGSVLGGFDLSIPNSINLSSPLPPPLPISSRLHCLAFGSSLLSLLPRLRTISRHCSAPLCDNAPVATPFVPRVTTSTTRVLFNPPFFGSGPTYLFHSFSLYHLAYFHNHVLLRYAIIKDWPFGPCLACFQHGAQVDQEGLFILKSREQYRGHGRSRWSSYGSTLEWPIAAWCCPHLQQKSSVSLRRLQRSFT
jgi:hypothetical protein